MFTSTHGVIYHWTLPLWPQEQVLKLQNRLPEGKHKTEYQQRHTCAVDRRGGLVYNKVPCSSDIHWLSCVLIALMDCRKVVSHLASMIVRHRWLTMQCGLLPGREYVEGPLVRRHKHDKQHTTTSIVVKGLNKQKASTKSSTYPAPILAWSKCLRQMSQMSELLADLKPHREFGIARSAYNTSFQEAQAMKVNFVFRIWNWMESLCDVVDADVVSKPWSCKFWRGSFAGKYIRGMSKTKQLHEHNVFLQV